VRALPFAGDDEALVRGLRRRDPAAVAAFCERYSDHVVRVLARLLGADRDLADLHHDVFVRALGALPKIREPDRLKGWISIIAVNVARNALKRRYRQRWLRFGKPEDLPEMHAVQSSDEQSDALRRTYAVLDRLPREERIAFSLRIIDGMKLTEVAAACEVSLATIKRRLARAEKRFLSLARADDVLADWIEGGRRWANR
jgi:RNA polymerase sigma-70 factor (ECF subfamily)